MLTKKTMGELNQLDKFIWNGYAYELTVTKKAHCYKHKTNCLCLTTKEYVWIDYSETVEVVFDCCESQTGANGGYFIEPFIENLVKLFLRDYCQNIAIDFLMCSSPTVVARVLSQLSKKTIEYVANEMTRRS